MKIKAKSRAVFLISLVILLPLSLNFRFLLGYYCLESSHIIKNKIPKISAITEPIYINGNNPDFSWTVAEAMGICTGSGTYSDPYIIKDLIIDGKGTQSCIWIENSYARFRIENCTVFNSGGSASNAGIKLSNAHWCQLIGNNCSYNTIGMRIYSSDVQIQGNTASYCSRGIYIYAYRYGVGLASENTVANNTVAGIYLEYCEGYEISDNTAINNFNGLYLTRSDNNQIFGNLVRNNTNHGISLYISNSNEIYENDACFNPYGIFAQGGYYNTFERNTVGNATEAGISLAYSNSNYILENTASNNTYGIELDNSDHNLISRNIVKNNIRGIYLSSSDYTIVSRNRFGGNNVCIAEDNCIGNEFRDNGYCTYGQGDKEDISLDLLISSLSIIGGSTIILALLLSNIKKRKKRY
jgi:parallel beta-helix repeat protein